MTRASISPLKRDGFTIDGTGYFAGHQESHRILYAKVPWCSMTLSVLSIAVPLAALAIGGIFNIPVLVLLAFVWLGYMVYKYAPRKKVKI